MEKLISDKSTTSLLKFFLLVFIIYIHGCTSTTNLSKAVQSTCIVEKAVPTSEYEITYQPIHDYGISFENSHIDSNVCKGSEINEPSAWRFYTRIGTDYGIMGTESRHVKWLESGQIQATLSYNEWAGVWHSLQGLSRENMPGLCFSQPYPRQIVSIYQPQIIGAYLKAKGKGFLKLEIKTTDQRGNEIEEPVRKAEVEVKSGNNFSTLVWDYFINNRIITTNEIRDPIKNKKGDNSKSIKDLPPIARFNWVIERKGSSIIVDEIGFVMAFPKIPLEKRIFLKSLAKLAFSYSEKYGLVRDRANYPAGEMDNIPASGMFCLALAAGQAEGFISREEAIRILRKTHKIIGEPSIVPRSHGLLPHFVEWNGDKYVSKAEYSTVDTAIYYHAMLIASRILKQDDIEESLIDDIKRINFAALTFPSGFITMGVMKDDKTILYDSWKHWGGESALVIMLKKMSGAMPIFPVSENSQEPGSKGNIYNGRGFIAEIQSLFYPQFDSDRPDKLTGQDWIGIRRRLLNDQIETTRSRFPYSKAAIYKLYGFSSGEIDYLMYGTYHKYGYCRYYLENGIEDYEYQKPYPVLFPHYILMSSCTYPDPSVALERIRILENENLFPPWGLVESFDTNLDKSLSMLSSLNASFEAISAYHLLCRTLNKPDAIYEAAENITSLREAVSIFY